MPVCVAGACGTLFDVGGFTGRLDVLVGWGCGGADKLFELAIVGVVAVEVDWSADDFICGCELGAGSLVQTITCVMSVGLPVCWSLVARKSLNGPTGYNL